MNIDLVSAKWANMLDSTQQDFIQAYVVTHSVKAASEMVGIESKIGRRYLASPTIQAAIKLTQKQIRDDAKVSPDEVITDLRLMRDMALGRVPVPETKWVDGEPVTRYVRQFNPGAANKAIENLGRVVAMFTDKKEVSVPATDNQLKKRLEDLLGVSLDVTDAEYTEVKDEVPELPAELAEVFDDKETAELTEILAKACDENGV